jgi:hypothetical protein
MFYDVWTRQGVSGNGLSVFLVPVSARLFPFSGMNFLKYELAKPQAFGERTKRTALIPKSYNVLYWWDFVHFI